MLPLQNILLTGASGTVGIEVLQLLIERDTFHVIVFDKKTIRSTRLFAPYKNRVNIIYGDICNERDIMRIPENIDTVIHLAAIIPPLAEENPLLTYNVNVNGTKGLLNGLEKKSPNAFFLYSSSVSVYGDRVSNPYITINDPINPSDRDLYGRSKIEAEDLIKNSKLNWSVFRLAAIMKNHKISKLMFHMPLETQLEICSPKDTAKAFVEAISCEDVLKGKVFNLGGGEKCRITYELFLQKSFNLFGLGKLNFPVNTFAQRNFHCGILNDGDELENILHFRLDTLDSYFEDTKKSISFGTKFLSTLFRTIIKRSLVKKSEPLNAVITNNKELLNHFFFKKKELPFNAL
jgi:nucleoside-diphosphate-sugar epimerase